MSSQETSRYTTVAIALHWVMAALVLFMIWLGWNMDENEARFQLHKIHWHYPSDLDGGTDPLALAQSTTAPCRTI